MSSSILSSSAISLEIVWSLLSLEISRIRSSQISWSIYYALCFIIFLRSFSWASILPFSICSSCSAVLLSRMMIIAARQRQRPNLARSRMKFSSALSSNPEALYHQTNFLECGGTLCWCLPAILGSDASSVSFKRTPELFCSTILCTHDQKVRDCLLSLL